MNSDASALGEATSSILIVVGEHTRSFNETNVNIMKEILKLFISICQLHESSSAVLPDCCVSSVCDVATSKIADKKLSSLCHESLTQLCTVSPPQTVMERLAVNVQKARSPLSHEESLRWLAGFIDDFGLMVIGGSVANLLPWLMKVRQIFLRYSAWLTLHVCTGNGVVEHQGGP